MDFVEDYGMFRGYFSIPHSSIEWCSFFRPTRRHSHRRDYTECYHYNGESVGYMNSVIVYENRKNGLSALRMHVYSGKYQNWRKAHGDVYMMIQLVDIHALDIKYVVMHAEALKNQLLSSAYCGVRI